jgi:hypothetical protein
MTRTFALAVGVAAVAAASSYTGDAHAQAVTATVAAPAVVESGGSAANRPGFSVAGVAGFGFADQGYGAAFEFGARAGYTLPMHLYVGGALGYSVNSFGIFHLQGEVGYELAVGSAEALLIRPYAGIGFGYASAGGGGSNCTTIDGVPICTGGGGGGGGQAAFLFSPGAVVAYFVTPNFFVGGDARIPFYIQSATLIGFDLLATGGYKF